jgi:hypothetical protein
VYREFKESPGVTARRERTGRKVSKGFRGQQERMAHKERRVNREYQAPKGMLDRKAQRERIQPCRGLKAPQEMMERRGHKASRGFKEFRVFKAPLALEEHYV